MPKPTPTTCTTVRFCTAAPTHEITAGGKIRGLPARASVDPVHLFACNLHLPIATGFTSTREQRTITELPPVQPTLLDNEE
jgi:hypothetical protein